MNNYTRAIEDFNKAIEINPKKKLAYHNRGVAYMALGNQTQAIESFNRAIEIDAYYAEAYYRRGILYNNLGKYRQAIDDFDKAMETNYFDKAGALCNRGAAYGSLGDRVKAIADYDRAIQIDPGYAEAYYSRAEAHAFLGNQGQATEDLKTAARLGHEDSRQLLKSQGITW
jgi:protein O-mannosyl-transferase